MISIKHLIFLTITMATAISAVPTNVDARAPGAEAAGVNPLVRCGQHCPGGSVSLSPSKER